VKFRGSKIVDPFWEEILDTFVRLHGSESLPKSYWEVMRSPLWYNALLTDRVSGASFGTKSALNAAKSGIVRICDIWDGHLHCWKTAMDCGLRQDLFRKIIDAVPESWLHYLQQGPGEFKVGDWLRFKSLQVPGDVYQVVESSSTLPGLCVHVHAIDESSTICMTHHLTLSSEWLLEHSANLVRFRVTFSPSARGFIYEGKLEEVTIIPENIFVDQVVNVIGQSTRCSLLKATVHGTYASLVRGSLGGDDLTLRRASFDKWTELCGTNPLPWKHVWQLVWNKCVDVSTRDFLWRLVHRALWVGFQFRSWAPDRCYCVCCGNGDIMETIEHRFLHCPGVVQVWSWMHSLMLRLCDVNLEMSVAFVCLGLTDVCRSKAVSMLCNAVRSECLKAIWHFRNRCVYDNLAFSTAALLSFTKDRVLRHLHTLKSSNSFPLNFKTLCTLATEDLSFCPS